MKKENFKLVIEWSAEDVKAVKPDWSDEQCEEFLADYQSDIEGACIQAGNEAIEMFLEDLDDEEIENDEDED